MVISSNRRLTHGYFEGKTPKAHWMQRVHVIIKIISESVSYLRYPERKMPGWKRKTAGHQLGCGPAV